MKTFVPDTHHTNKLYLLTLASGDLRTDIIEQRLFSSTLPKSELLAIVNKVENM